MTDSMRPGSDERKGAAFATTHWSVVIRAGDGSSSEAKQALGTLFSTYWYPLYAYARRRGCSVEHAQDLTQGFFARVLDKSYFENADQNLGRFRAYLLTMFKRYLSNERDHANAAKRGGGKPDVSLDQARFDFQSGERRYSIEPSVEQSPEKLFERQWALAMLDHVMSLLEQEYKDQNKSEFFEHCHHHLTIGNRSQNESREKESDVATENVANQALASQNSRFRLKHGEISAALGMNDNALSVAIHRMKQRYRKLLIAEIKQTLAEPENKEELQQELSQLRNALT